MKIIGLEHIGIAVDSLKSGAEFWGKIIGLKYLTKEDVDGQGVITDIYSSLNCKIELLLSKYPDSPIGKFIKKHGKGIHHICFQVENIDDAIKHITDNDIKIIGEKVSIGAEGYKVIFIHPSSTGGVLVELAEKQ